MKEMNVLLLEDELALAYTLSASLQKDFGDGCTVKICNTAEVAMQMLKLHKFDLIISDWRLPGISGLEFITEVRKSMPEVPIIFMTAFGSDEFEEQVNSISDRYLKKPFNTPELTEAVSDLLDSKNNPFEIAPISAEKPHRILVLEDDESLLRLYKKVFSKLGHIVRDTKTLPEANNLLANEDFDLFICDVRIDKSFGIDLLLIWREKLLKNNTKVAVVSGDPWYRVMSEKIGADFFFRKPVEISTLINLVNGTVSQE
ncbi:MAG: hypothetical protein DPW18_09420 [Chloroflexi bacterium]|nr:MAG: response regulator [Chloroflexota bacterium]MCQ3937252.1 hypothetical protein [Chloroflexota bacterium]MDL1943510.1 response regulator [Chloroflexi bacterium CFX2]